MLKKVHTLNPSDTSILEKKQIECSVCKTKANCIPFVCESGHVICKTCQRSDTTLKGSHEGGDFKLKEAFSPDDDIKQLKIIKSDTKVTDLTNGDQRINNELSNQGIHNEGKKCCNEDFDDTLSIYKDLYPKNSKETIIEFKNAHFQDSKSSITAKVDDCTKNTENSDDDDDDDDNNEVDSCNVVQRPVVCPVTVCSKIVTLDSIMLHFLFDHSKVPRTTLDDTTPQEVLLKPANFTTDIQCVASYIMEAQTRPNQTLRKKIELTSSVGTSKKGNKLLLLLAVKLPIHSAKVPNVKCDSSQVFTKSIYTQTEKMNESFSETSTEYDNKSSSDYKSCTSKSVLEEDEVLLLWLCKLDDVRRVFTITLLGEDKRRGYCYIGDALNIRDKQDPALLYDRSECLIIKASAISGLFDDKGQITAIVSLIGC